MILTKARLAQTNRALSTPWSRRLRINLIGFAFWFALIGTIMQGLVMSSAHAQATATTPTPSAAFTANGGERIVVGPNHNVEYKWDLAGIPGGIIYAQYRLINPSATSCGTVDGIWREWTPVANPVDGRAKGTRTDPTGTGQIGCTYELRLANQTNGIGDASATVIVEVSNDNLTTTAASSTDAMPSACYLGTQIDTTDHLLFMQMLQTNERNMLSKVASTISCLLGSKAVRTKVYNAYSIPTAGRILKTLKDSFGVSGDLTTAGLVARLRTATNQTVTVLNEGTWRITAQMLTGSSGTQTAYFLASWTPNANQGAENIQLQSMAVAPTASDPFRQAATMSEVQKFRDSGMMHPLDPDIEYVPTTVVPPPPGTKF